MFYFLIILITMLFFFAVAFFALFSMRSEDPEYEEGLGFSHITYSLETMLEMGFFGEYDVAGFDGLRMGNKVALRQCCHQQEDGESNPQAQNQPPMRHVWRWHKRPKSCLLTEVTARRRQRLSLSRTWPHASTRSTPHTL